MIFSSTIFIIYFLPLFLGIYFLAKKKLHNAIVLAFSVFFYAWGAPSFVFILLASTFVNYLVVQKMNKSTDKKHKQIFLWTSVIINLGLLAYFKYANFFIENTNGILTGIGVKAIEWTKIALPIGISFFTFQSLTYTIDTYRKISKPLEKYTDYLLYILMFPQLIAGPIVRYNTIAEQIKDRSSSMNDRLVGFYRFSIGLAKKVLIANVMAETADQIMAMDYVGMNSTTAWIGILAYTFQIYFDFAGYSDMAIGIGKMIGFSFPENFNNPYTSRNITEFWKRWHITLGAWMRDYLYIPLGGNRVNKNYRLYINLSVVFLISGLWHGASWNFVLWGAFHGFFLILDRLFLIKLTKKIGRLPSSIFCFFTVVMSWVIFRIEDFNMAILYYKRLFAFDFSNITMELDSKFISMLFIAIFFSFFTLLPYGNKIHDAIFIKKYSKTMIISFFFIALILFFVSTSHIIAGGFNPFIYYRF